MDGDKGIRGWIAALTVGIMLTVVAVFVEQKLRVPSARYYRASQTAESAGATTQPRGITLAVDPGLIATEQFPLADRTPLARNDSEQRNDTASLLRRPPEPSMQVVLRAPTAHDLDVMPLTTSTSHIDYLMDAINRAFESPIQVVSEKKEQPNPEINIQGFERLANSPGPTAAIGRFPQPNSLLLQLEDLDQKLRTSSSQFVSIKDGNAGAGNYSIPRDSAKPHYVSTAASNTGSWIGEVNASILRLVNSDALGKASRATQNSNA